MFLSSLRFKHLLAALLFCLGPLAFSSARGAEQTVELNGVSMTLQDVTSQTAVYYTSMRLNRALNIWNVEAAVSNKSVQTFTGPLVLVVDSAQGTSGLLQPDGLAGVSPVVDLSRRLAQNVLAPGQLSTPQTLSFGVSNGTPSLTTRVFALPAPATNLAVGFVRTLDEVGHPLASVTVEESGPADPQTNQTDSAYGAATLGEGPGQYTWKFSTPGFLPVWRRQTLGTNGITEIIFPRLTRRSTNTIQLSPLQNGAISNSTVTVAFASSSVNSNQTVTLTPLSGQTLPAFLPQGWSPLQAFWLEMPGQPAIPPGATAQLWGALNPGDTGALAVWNSQAFEWDIVEVITNSAGGTVNLTLPGAGAYVFVVGDSSPSAAPAPQVNQPLAPSTAPVPDISALTVSGQVGPSSSPASLNPDLVTGTAVIVIAPTNGAGGLASGLLLECDVQEQYQLASGTAPVTPAYENFIVGYQRPGTNSSNTLQAAFPIRPLQLYGPAQLNEALVTVGVVPPGLFSGVLLTTNGGQMVSGDVQLLAGAGALSGPQAMLVTSLAPTNFASLATNLAVLDAFDLTVTGLLPGSSLALELGSGPTNALLVVARVIQSQGINGLEPVARLTSDGQGRITSLETNATDQLPGINESGQYVVVQVNQPQALVKGIALNSQGQPAGGLVAQLGPWTTLSRTPDGQFLLIAPTGTNQISVSDLATGDTGQGNLPIAPGQNEVTPTLGTGLAGLQVVLVTPANNATNVPQVASITINFSRPLNPATLSSNSVQLLEGGSQPVSATLSLNLANTTATLLPSTPLDAAASFTIALATNITDTTGRPLQGQNQFTFTTMPLSTRDPTAQLIVYEPGATNVPVALVAKIPGYVPGADQSAIMVQGTPGVADPGVPVVLANESTGDTTTVISQTDGSFVSLIEGVAQDIVSATFIGLNGSRLYVPVTRQLFDDGSVGLYQQGGMLQAQGDGGAVQVTVPPSAIATRTKFKLNSVNVPELQTQLAGVMPTNSTVAGGALNLNIQGQIPTLPLQVRFPVNLTAVGYPTNEIPTNAAAMLAVVQNAQEVTSFQVVDQLLFTPGTNSPQSRLGYRRMGSGDNDQLAAGFLDTSIGLVIPALGIAGQLAQVGFNQVLVPLLFGPRPVVIKGKVASLPINIAEGVEKAGLLSQIVNLQTGIGAIDVPFTLAQMMGLASNPLAGPGGVVQSLVQVGVFAFEQQEIRISTPLSGAFITCQLSGGPLVIQPGRLNPGMVYATSGSDGYFLMVAPAAGAQYLVTATHPLFTDILQQPVNPISANPLSMGDLSLAGAVYKNFFFQTLLLDQSPPTVSVANTPVQPGAGQSCQVVVNASQPTATPTIGVGVVSVGTNDLLTGQILTNVQYTLTNITRTPGPNNSLQWSATLTVNHAVLVNLKVVVQGQNGNQTAVIPYQIAFTGPVPATPISNIPPPGTNDMHGPLVTETDPVNNGFIGENSAITITFNKPIDSFVTNHLQGISLVSQGGSAGTPPNPIVQLSPGQTTLALQYPGLAPATTYRLTLSGQSIRDLATQPLDQLPSTPAPDSFTMTFRTPPAATTNLPITGNWTGTAISGNHLYALDQAPNDNYLEIYDISIPLQPKLLSQTHLFGAPRGLVVIPHFGYQLNAQAPAVTNDLVAVVGGDLSAIINTNQGDTVTVPGQYLWVLNVGDPTSPQVLASPIVSYLVGSAVTKVIWAPPYLVYQEFGSDIQQIGFVNMQEMLYGFGSSRIQEQAFPVNGRPGVDLNGDGSYTGPGETVPIPPLAPPEFYGKHQSYVLQGSTQKILDFSVTPAGRTVGVTLTSGVTLDSLGNPTGAALPFSYRTFVSSGLALNIPSPTDAMVIFGNTAYPRWVSVFDALPIQVNGATITLSLALVSLTPDTNGLPELAVIDISLPEKPNLLNKIPVPTSLLGGNMQSLVLRSDGLLELAGDQNVVLLNPAYLAITNFPAGQLHPAIVQVIAGAGANTRSLGVGNNGVYAAAVGARSSVVQSPPVMQFVSFPNNNGIVDPTMLRQMNQTNLNQLFSGKVNSSGALAPARFQPETNLFIPSDLEPTPNPALHYHVLVATPGGAGSTIELGLESLNFAGFPLSNPGHSFAPVRAESVSTQQAIGQTPRPNCGAPISPVMAYRVSDDPTSAYYNFYLSQPFALITEAASLDDLTRLTTEVNRQILFSGAELRAFIEPEQSTNPVVGPFAAQIDTSRQLVYPIASVSALTVNRSYILGDNPPPAGGAAPMEDTYGTIQAHSGELRAPDIDMVLPSPHMQIAIVRVIGNQDNYEGPFGVGWDFNYNQRLTVLDPLTFPAGLQMPLVVRDNKADSEIAGTQDVLLNTGEGQVYHFLWKDTNMPSEYAQDPLVKQLDYKDLVSDYYLPQHGLFDLLVKFIDGRFERLTASGMRYEYSPQGRLEMIIDRFPQNHHDLQYDSGDRLVRIDDHSVSAPRYVQFGYYRRQGTDPDFTAGLDMDTSDSFLEGKICQLVDYTGRNVLYQYTDDGFLTNKMGIQVNGENGGYAGRSHTYYTYNNCQLVGISATTNGTPLISAVNATSASGKPVAQSTTSSHGNDQLSIPVNNSAATVGTQTAGVTMGDGSSVQRKFDAMGYVSFSMVMGPSGAPATEITSNTADGLEYYIMHPEGNTEMKTYDSSNAVFRSRGNLTSVKVNPGPRGGQGYTQTFNYDPRYNLPSGDQVNPDGFHITSTLSADGLYVQSMIYAGAGTKTFTYNGNGQVTDTVDENGIESSTMYDGNTGFPMSQTTGNGPDAITVMFSYDGSIPAQLGRPTTMAKPLGSPTAVIYNNLLQPVAVDRGAYVTTTAYDELGRGIMHQEQVGDGQVWTSTIGYNDAGFVTNTTMAGIEINGTDGGSVSYDYTPDKRMRVQSMTYPSGTVLTNSYDNRGNRISSTVGDYTQQFTYDLNNNQTSLIQGGDLVQTMAYDGLDRATNVTFMTGTSANTVTTTYYAGGELQSSTITDPQFGVIKSETVDQIDAFGRALGVTEHGTTISPQFQYAHNALSSSVTSPRMMTATTTWNSAGNRTGVSNPIVKLTIKLDANGRVMETDQQEDNATFSNFFKYDTLDHQTSLADLVGTLSTYAPRADGNDDTITDANGHTLTMGYTSLGEIARRQRADGMTTLYKHDTERRVVYEGDPGKGFSFGFDSDLRLTNSTLRNGADRVYGGFDPRNMPGTIALPGGGTEMLKYDLQTRMMQRKVNYQSTTWEEDPTYDALGRQRAETYIQNGGANNTATYDYDEAGPLLAAHYTEDNATFNVTNAYNSDASRLSVTYPSGVTVTETRDNTGRLTGVSDANGNIISASSWVGNLLPKVVQLGSTMQIVYTYDARERLTGSRVTRLGDGAVLAHMRYQYDSADNLQIRQFIHRGGKADVFGYDTGERLAQAKVGVLVTNAAGSGPLLYQRQYNYDSTGLDFLTVVPATGPLMNPPAFATNWTGNDDFLLPSAVNTFGRSDDPMGNVAQAQLWVRPAGGNTPQAVQASLQHDGLGRMTSVTRADGVSVVNQYQPSGLRFSRQVRQGAQLTAYSTFVYDDAARLIEEYDRTGAQPVLIARYYYATGDSPAAADLLDQSSGQLKRYYFLRDTSQSVIAVADATGNVVERAWYDPFGQPVIEQKDVQPPALQSVVAGDTNSLFIVLSEPVQAPSADPGPGGGIVPFSSLIFTGVVSISIDSSNIAGGAVLLPSQPGYPPYSVLQYTPGQPLPTNGPVTLTLNAGFLVDEWGNTNASQSVTLTATGGVGTVYYQASPARNTAPVQTARSSVGSPFLFHGQYFDYDTGLIYLRARFYDPFSGMYFEPDPMGYEDSVNHYAGLGNNPVGMRDPSGLKNVREAYNEHAVKAPGVDERVLAARDSSEGQGLAAHGIGDHNGTAILGAGRELLPKAGEPPGTVTIVLKYSNEPKFVRFFANEGVQQKAEWIVKKSKLGRIFTREKGWYVADQDGLYIQRDGQILDYEQVKEFRDRANEISVNLAKTFQEARGDKEKGGFRRIWEKVSEPFQHGFTANLMEEIGREHYHGHGETRGKDWIGKELRSKIKKIPDGFAITLHGTQDNFTLDPISHVSREEVKSVFTKSLDAFHEKLNTDVDTYIRVTEEQERGSFDMEHSALRGITTSERMSRFQ